MSSGVFVTDLYKYTAAGKGAGALYTFFLIIVKRTAKEFGAKCYIYTFLSALCFYIVKYPQLRSHSFNILYGLFIC